MGSSGSKAPKGGLSGSQAAPIIPKRLYVGDRLDGIAAKQSNPMRFTHVLCLEPTSRYPDNDKLNFMLEPLADDGSSDFSSVVRKVSDFVIQGSKQRLLIHCASGINRSAAIAVWYLAAHEGFTLAHALEHVAEQREGVSIHKRYVAQLEAIFSKHQPEDSDNDTDRTEFDDDDSFSSSSA